MNTRFSAPLLLVIAWLIGGPAWAATKAVAFVAESNAPVLESPLDGSAVLKHLSVGDRLEIRAIRGSWVQMQCFRFRLHEKKCEGWMHADQIATRKQFCRVAHWNGPLSLELEQGDYGGTYYFFSSGRFAHVWSGGTETNFEAGTDLGEMYWYRSILWAVNEGGDGDLFLIKQNSSLCWYYDQAQCAPWPTPNPSVKGTSCAEAQAAPYVER